MKIFSLITASIIAGSVMGLFADSPAWLLFPLVFFCAAGAIGLSRLLSGPRRLSLWNGAVVGVLSGIWGVICGMMTSFFSGKLIALITTRTYDFVDANYIVSPEKAYLFVLEYFLHNLALYSILSLAGGVVGAIILKRIASFQRHFALKAGKAVIRRLLLNIFGLIAGISIGVIVPVYPALETVLSLTKVDEYPLYVMTYKNGYGFDELLKTGINRKMIARHESMEEQPVACSCFVALNENGTPLFGRNWDWPYEVIPLLLYTSPPGGYASVSMVNIAPLVGWKKLDLLQRINLLFAPYSPTDGMNEYGLTFGEVAVLSADGGRDPAKVTLHSAQAMRLVLDHARDVDEAIALLEQYNIDWGYFRFRTHFLLADPSGDSAVVEFIDGKMAVTRTNTPWQVLTDFIISDATEKDKAACWRYTLASEKLKRADGLFSQEDTLDLLEELKCCDINLINYEDKIIPTIWSVAYDMASGEFQVVMGRQFDRVHTFNLKMKTVE